MTKKIRVAIIHEWLFSYRGAERVLDELLNMFPEADVYSLFGNVKKLNEMDRIKGRDIHYSFLNKLPLISQYYRYTYFLWPLAIESFNLKDYDLVISLSSVVAHGVLTGINTKHFAYVNTPMRYAWDMKEEYFRKENFSYWKRKVIPFFLHFLRIWDVTASNRPDIILANSQFVSRRIFKYWNRKTDGVVYPPVDLPNLPSMRRENFFLYHGALEPNKGVIQLINSAIKYDFPLVLSGKGSLLRKVRRMIKNNPNITILGEVSEKEKWKLYSQAKAFIFPSIEDFGIVSVESIWAGCPVVALNYGGSPEIVREGVNGVYIKSQDPKDIFEGIKKISKMKFDISSMKKSVEKFSKDRFRRDISKFLEGGTSF